MSLMDEPPAREPCCPRAYLAIFVTLALGITALDLWSKATIFRLLKVELVPRMVDGQERLAVAPHQPIVIIPDLFEIEANINYGAFSGWFSRHTEYLAVLSIAALGLIIWFMWSHRNMAGARRLWLAAAFGLLWGGTCGNFHDRAFLGYVRDFVKWFYVSGGQQHVWPNFNVADSCILVGVGLLLLIFMRAPISKPEAAKTAKAT
jgi:signal peptidase II